VAASPSSPEAKFNAGAQGRRLTKIHPQTFPYPKISKSFPYSGDLLCVQISLFKKA